MSGRRPAAVVVGLAVALGGALPAQLRGEVQWRLPAAGVAFGDPFEFVLAWQWPAAATPMAPAIDAWGPLACRRLGRETLPGGDGERWRYRAVAWGTGALELPPLVLRATTADGHELTAVGTVPPLVVAPRLDAADVAIEWPDLFAPRPRRWGAWWFAAVLAGLCGGGLWWHRRRA
ncbi:MAG: hypothetical protein KF830_18750, partial [Planctomycetes bacterium]|nr:hypothetical protein [Planctomycetota bacterium]